MRKYYKYIPKQPKPHIYWYAIFILLIITPKMKAQDMFYSYYQGNALYLNPAETGHFYGDWRVAGNFRDQWRALNIPYNTFSAAFDKNVYILGNRIGAGIYALNDQAGEVGIRTSRLHVSAAYELAIRTHLIRIGLQTGINHKAVDFSNLSLPGNYNRSTGSYDPSELNNENLYQFDVGVGGHYRTKWSRFEPSLGTAFFHLNNPVNSFYDNSDRLGLRMVSYLAVKTTVNDASYASPKLFFMYHDKQTNYMAGIESGYNIPGKSIVKQVIAGGYFRSGSPEQIQSLVIQAGATIRRLTVVINYDFTLSAATFNPPGAFEVSFVYRSLSTVLNSYSIPCDRF